MTPRGCAASIPAAPFERLARRKPTLRVVAGGQAQFGMAAGVLCAVEGDPLS